MYLFIFKCNLRRSACPTLELACFYHSFCINVLNTNLTCCHYYYSFQRLTCLDFWHMIKQHYGQDLGLTHEEMESLQSSTESSMQARWPSTQHTLLTAWQCLDWHGPCSNVTLPVGVSARPRGPALMRSSGGWNTRPLCASRGQSTRLWTPRRPKGKRCLPLWAHKTPTTRYESGIFNCAALCMFGLFFFFLPIIFI